MIIIEIVKTMIFRRLLNENRLDQPAILFFFFHLGHVQIFVTIRGTQHSNYGN